MIVRFARGCQQAAAGPLVNLSHWLAATKEMERKGHRFLGQETVAWDDG